MSFVKPVIVVTPPAHHPLPADSAATTLAPGPPAVNTGTQAVPHQQPSRAAKSAHSTGTPPPPCSAVTLTHTQFIFCWEKKGSSLLYLSDSLRAFWFMPFPYCSFVLSAISESSLY
eukprot:scpid105810/ scgid20178/ 